mmetsp:Transcript_21618/g.31966  ORF Transcript_21618/g.31966 Transcript_21618/m.31966 type:complete len:428 (+) Transcript_21618:120-1403(+)
MDTTHNPELERQYFEQQALQYASRRKMKKSSLQVSSRTETTWNSGGTEKTWNSEENIQPRKNNPRRQNSLDRNIETVAENAETGSDSKPRKKKKKSSRQNSSTAAGTSGNLEMPRENPRQNSLDRKVESVTESEGNKQKTGIDSKPRKKKKKSSRRTLSNASETTGKSEEAADSDGKPTEKKNTGSKRKTKRIKHTSDFDSGMAPNYRQDENSKSSKGSGDLGHISSEFHERPLENQTSLLASRENQQRESMERMLQPSSPFSKPNNSFSQRMIQNEQEQERILRIQKENQNRLQQRNNEREELIAKQLATKCVVETFRNRQTLTNPMADPREDEKYASRVAAELTSRMLHNSDAMPRGSGHSLADNAVYHLPNTHDEAIQHRLTKFDRVEMERRRLERHMVETTKGSARRSIWFCSCFPFGSRKTR